VIKDVDSYVGSLHLVDLGSAAYIPELHTASIFRVEVSRISSIYRFRYNGPTGGRGGRNPHPWVKANSGQAYVSDFVSEIT
jgi:hypothetical protein